MNKKVKRFLALTGIFLLTISQLQGTALALTVNTQEQAQTEQVEKSAETDKKAEEVPVVPEVDKTVETPKTAEKPQVEVEDEVKPEVPVKVEENKLETPVKDVEEEKTVSKRMARSGAVGTKAVGGRIYRIKGSGKYSSSKVYNKWRC